MNYSGVMKWKAGKNVVVQRDSGYVAHQFVQKVEMASPLQRVATEAHAACVRGSEGRRYACRS